MFNQFGTFELLIDLNQILKKRMIALILNIYGNGESFEVEFVRLNGTNFEYENSNILSKQRNDQEKCHH